MDHLIELTKPIAAAMYRALSYVTQPGQRIYWLYIISSLLIAALLYMSASRRRGQPLKLRDYIDFCFPAEVWKSASARLDVRYFIVCQTIHILVFTSLSGLLILIYNWSLKTSVGAFGSAGWVQWKGQQPGLPALLAMALMSSMVVDFVLFCAHVLQHRWSFLWEFHKVHHSATALHPLTNYREHIVDNLLYVFLGTCTSGFLGGFLYCWYPRFDKIQFLILGVPLVSFIYNFFGYNLRHSHVWLAWPPALGRVFGSPANHQIHHSAETRHMNKNFGFMFAIWDWMFGTLYLPPKQREEFSFGLADGTHAEYSSIVRLYTLPFVKLYEKYAPRRLAGNP